MNAGVGDIVECINDKPSSGYPPGFKLPFVKGQLYKVVALGLTPGNKRPAYALENIPDFWTRTRFRKIEGDKTAFDEMLKKHKPVPTKKVLEDA